MEPTPTREEIPAEPDRQAQETKPQQQAPAPVPVQRALFGQDRWMAASGSFAGR